MMSWANHLKIMEPSAVALAQWLLGAAMLTLLIARGRRFTWGRLALVAVVVAAATGIAWVIVEKWWHPVAEGLGDAVWWGTLALFAAAGLLLTPSNRRRPNRSVRRIVLTTGRDLLLVAIIAGAVGILVNYHFRAFHTLGDLLGTSVKTKPIDADHHAGPLQTPLGTPLSTVWKAPADLPKAGQLSWVEIAGTKSGFNARKALIYLPPAYLTSQRPLLPVLILMAGQPGAPVDWQTGGMLQQTMDAYASAHDGLAPIVVVPDNLGASTSNPLCSDTKSTKVATYLERDVPDWVMANLQVDTRREHWAVAGSSNGGTCSLQIATRVPDAYPTFLDMSGEVEPTLGSRERTIQQGFDGDAAAFAANNPLDLLAKNRYPQVAGKFYVGADDASFLAEAKRLFAAAEASGMHVELHQLPGGHSWTFWSAALREATPWLGGRMGLTP